VLRVRSDLELPGLGALGEPSVEDATVDLIVSGLIDN
jgi:hypothetical protein